MGDVPKTGFVNAISDKDGEYLIMKHPTDAGTCTLIAEAAGYEKFETQVTPTRAGSVTRDIPMTLATVDTGDINGDGGISQADAVPALQMAAGRMEFRAIVIRNDMLLPRRLDCQTQQNNTKEKYHEFRTDYLCSGNAVQSVRSFHALSCRCRRCQGDPNH